MPEVTQPPQQPRSPDQSPGTPTGAFKNFMKKWEATRYTVLFTSFTTLQAMLTVDALARGDYRNAIGAGILTGVGFIGNILTAHERDRDVQKRDNTIQQQHQTIEELQGRNQPR